jgi:hypothetical protein
MVMQGKFVVASLASSDQIGRLLTVPVPAPIANPLGTWLACPS